MRPRFTLLPGMTNVVRFPVERRAKPTLDLLREITPDVREVLCLADALGFEAPAHDLREQTDAATAEHILNQAPVHGPAREAMLAELEARAITGAIAACHAASDAAIAASEACQVLAAAEHVGGYWLDPLRERAATLEERAALLMLAAHVHAEEAEGVARAVSLARRGEAWTPRDLEAEWEGLLACYRAAG